MGGSRDDNCLVGEFRIRHHLTDALREGAGHIGYSISKEHRGKGYGTEGLRLTIEIAGEIVPEDEIFLRVNKDNIASQKVMIHNGAYRAGEDEEHYFMRIKKTPAKQIQLINDDYLGHVGKLRHASRGILVSDGKILLCHEQGSGLYIIPGGGEEGAETYAECCEREVLEETGYRTGAINGYLDIEELFDVWRHINHYFICELIEDTECQHLTEAEKVAGYTNVWLPLQQAMDIFGQYETYLEKDIAVYGLYRREYTALKEYESYDK